MHAQSNKTCMHITCMHITEDGTLLRTVNNQLNSHSNWIFGGKSDHGKIMKRYNILHKVIATYRLITIIVCIHLSWVSRTRLLSSVRNVSSLMDRFFIIGLACAQAEETSRRDDPPRCIQYTPSLSTSRAMGSILCALTSELVGVECGDTIQLWWMRCELIGNWNGMVDCLN